MTDTLCKTCRFWIPPCYHPLLVDGFRGMGRCSYIDSSDNIRLRMVALDDGGDDFSSATSLRTSPQFGCTRYEVVKD